MKDYIALPVMQEVFFELLAGVSLKSKKSGYEITISDPENNNKPYDASPGLFIDGVTIKDAGVIAGLDPELVEKIDVIKEKYSVGDYLFYGIVNIITKSGDFNNVNLPDYAIRLPYRVIDPVYSFVSPDYSSAERKKSRIPDFRNTLYWNPSVKPDKKGKASIEFWTSDFSSDFEVNIQGITSQGGKVEPARVETSLPELIERARKYNLAIDMIVTGIASAAEPYTEKILKTASASGVKYYRLNWFEYDFKYGIWETLQKYRNILIDIVELNRKYKIHAGYQNHSGIWVGGPVWDLHELLRDFPPELLGSQYDVRHAMVEGTDTWMIGMRLIASHIKTLAIKDFTWKTEAGRPEPVSRIHLKKIRFFITAKYGETFITW